MNVKKTIASIAAIAMVASATSLAPLFTGTSISAEETAATGSETPAEDPNAGIAPFALPSESNDNVPVANLTGATGTAAYEKGETTGGTLTITLTKGDGSVGGEDLGTDLDDNNSGGEADYAGGAFRVILSGDYSEYTFDASSQYKADNGGDGSTNLTANGLYLYFDPRVVLDENDAHYSADGVEYTVVIKTESGEPETITVILKAADEEPPVVDPVPDNSPKLVGGADATTGTYTATIEIEGSTLPDKVTIDIGGENVEFTKGADGKYTADIEITDANLDDFKTGFELGFIGADDKTYTVTSAEAVKKAEEKPPVKDPDDDIETTDPTDEEKLGTANEKLEEILDTNDFTWVKISDLENWGAAGIVTDLQNKVQETVESATVTMNSYTVGEDGMVTFNVTVKVGDAEEVKTIVVTVTDDSAADNGGDQGGTTTPAPAPTVSAPPVVSNNPVNSAPAASEQTVSSPVQISGAKQKEVTVNAAETEVTPAMVQAFTKNKNTKTLTLKYSSSLKIAVDKNDVNNSSANLDFSVSGKKFISDKTIAKSAALKDASKIVQLDFVNAGKLEGVDKVTIKSRIGMDYVGKTVIVYEYVDGKLVKVGKAEVNGAGIAKFNTNYLGQFVLVVE